MKYSLFPILLAALLQSACIKRTPLIIADETRDLEHGQFFQIRLRDGITDKDNVFYWVEVLDGPPVELYARTKSSDGKTFEIAKHKEKVVKTNGQWNIDGLAEVEVAAYYDRANYEEHVSRVHLKLTIDPHQ